MNETKTLEFKENVTNTFLKTVSAYANYGDGEICFGISDDGTVKGLDDIENTKLDIENKINDAIQPHPDFYFVEHKKDNTLSLLVRGGANKPYLYRGKAYKRNDTSTVEVDMIEFRRLVLEGTNQTFEEQKSKNQNMTFAFLEREFAEKLGIKKINLDILKTLNLYDDSKGYNIAASLLSDKNDFPGIDMVKFGDSLDTIKERKTSSFKSILAEQYDAVEFYKRYYQEEVIEGMERKKRDIVPEKAFREAVANALVHREWDINSNINIRMFDDRIEIVSAGGLPSEISEDEYLRGGISILRNPIIANVFFRLHYIEAFGTGVQRIKAAYYGKNTKPEFEILANSIKIVLPKADGAVKLSRNEETVYSILDRTTGASSTEISEKTNFSKNKVLRILKALEDKHLINVTGTARATKYSKV